MGNSRCYNFRLFSYMAQTFCTSCKKEDKRADQALLCELCGKWEHLSCMREIDKPSEELYTLLCQSQCNALWAVCIVCRSQGSMVKKTLELESKTLDLEERLRTSEMLLQEKDRLTDRSVGS